MDPILGNSRNRFGKQNPFWLIPMRPLFEPDFGEETAIVPSFKASVLNSDGQLNLKIAALSPKVLWVFVNKNHGLQEGETVGFRLPGVAHGGRDSLQLQYQVKQEIDLQEHEHILECHLSPAVKNSDRKQLSDFIKEKRYQFPLGPDQESKVQTSRLHTQLVIENSPWHFVTVALDKKQGFKPVASLIRKEDLKDKKNLRGLPFWPEAKNVKAFSSECLTDGRSLVVTSVNCSKKSDNNCVGIWSTLKTIEQNNLLNGLVAGVSPDCLSLYEIRCLPIPNRSKEAIKSRFVLNERETELVDEMTHTLWYREIIHPAGAKLGLPVKRADNEKIKLPAQLQANAGKTNVATVWPPKSDPRKEIRLSMPANNIDIFLGKITKAKGCLLDFSLHGCRIEFAEDTKFTRLKKYIRITLKGTTLKRIKYQLVKLDKNKRIGHFKLDKSSYDRFDYFIKPLLFHVAEQQDIRLNEEGTREASASQLYLATQQLVGQYHPGCAVLYRAGADGSANAINSSLICYGLKKGDTTQRMRLLQAVMAHWIPDLEGQKEATMQHAERYFPLKALWSPDGEQNILSDNLLSSAELGKPLQWHLVVEESSRTGLTRIDPAEFCEKTQRMKLMDAIESRESELYCFTLNFHKVETAKKARDIILKHTRQVDPALANLLKQEMSEVSHIVYIDDQSPAQNCLLSLSMNY